MSRRKSLVQMLASCEKHDFDKVVRAYLKDVYSYTRIVQTDGKDDCGLDVKVFDFSDSKIQYQMTIQKSSTSAEMTSLSNKIFEDVAKAKNNTEEYGWSNKLIFFYSYELTNKKIREFERRALGEFGINLEIIDANRIAEESEEYLELQKAIYETSGIAEFKLKQSLYDDENNNLIYDLVSFGQSVDIKLEIVEAYILRCLYDKGQLNISQISELCQKKFSTNENQAFYIKLTQNMCNKNKLLYYKVDKTYGLTTETSDEIVRQSNQIRIDEQQFLNQIGTVLMKYHQEEYINEYVDLIKNIYIECFNKRIEVRNDVDNIASLNKLSNYIKSNIKDDNSRILLTKGLLEICDNNKYLQKICASYIFSQKVNINDLHKYAKERKRVFLDTTIALNILCYFYNTNINYHNYNYNLSKALCDFCKKNGIKLYLTRRYLWEIGTHIQEAFNLIPFTKLPNFSVFGKSRNVFFNYYNHLIDTHEIDCSYEDYLREFGFTESHNTNCQQVEHYLKRMCVYVIDIPTYEIQTESKLIGNKLSETGRFKTQFALNNDAIMLKYLGDSNSDVHPIDPVFVTWDKTIFGVLKEYYQKNPAAHRWMQFTPGQFIDRYSLLSFSINEETISRDMLAIISGDIVQHTASLIDSLSLILNPNDEVGLEYTKKFAEMKDNQIYMTSKSPEMQQETVENNTLDIVVFKIISHYRDDYARYNSFKNLFTSKEYVDDVIAIFNDAITYYQHNHQFDTGVISKFNNLLTNI